MATFRENLNQELRESLRDRIESSTGIFGQALKSKRENEEKAKEVQAQTELINTTTGKLRSTSAALSSMEASFIQMSKNMRLIAEAMGAEVTLQKDLDESRKKLDEIAKKRLELQQQIGSKRKKDLSKLNKRVNESINQQKQNKSLFEKILDLLDDLPGGRRGGRGRGRGRGPRLDPKKYFPDGSRRAPPLPGQQPRTPPAGQQPRTPPSAPQQQPRTPPAGGAPPAGQQPRTPPAGQQPRVPTGGTPPRTPPRIPTLPPGAAAGAGRVAGAVLGPAAAAATVAYGTYEAAKFARQSELGRRLAEGEGGRAQTAFRQRETQYSVDISPEGARAILDQPDSPGKRRDIEAFGGKDRLEKLAKQARQQTPTPTRQQIYGQAAGRQRQASSQAAVASDGGAAFRRSERAYAGTQVAPARDVQENVFTGPMTATRQRDVQENVFTGPMTPAARPATQQRPAAAQPAAAPRPAAQQPAPAGSTVGKVLDKQTDDQGAKTTAVNDAPQRRDNARFKRPSNVILGDRADITSGKVNEGLLQRVYLAAKKYGKRVVITSAYRSDNYQAELYVRGYGGQPEDVAAGRIRPKDWPTADPNVYIPSLPKTPQTVLWKGRTYQIRGSGRHNVHLEQSELDVSPGTYGSKGPVDPVWINLLKEFGVVYPYGKKDPPHISISANAPPLASLLQGESLLNEGAPSNVVTSGDGTPVRTGSGGFLTTGPQPAAPTPARPAARPQPQAQVQQRPSAAASGDSMQAKAARLAAKLRELGITNKFAIAAIVATAAKESGLNPLIKEYGVQSWIKTLNGKGVDYVYLALPQLGPKGRVAVKLGFPQGLSKEQLLEMFSKMGDPEFFDFVYGDIPMNPQKGDGYKYRGRGLIGITGRTVYRGVGKLIGMDLENDPDSIVKDFDVAASAAAGYLMMTLGGKSQGLNKLNSYTSMDSALRDVILSVAGRGNDIRKFDIEKTNLREQYTKAGSFVNLASSASGVDVGNYSVAAAQYAKGTKLSDIPPTIVVQNNNNTTVRKPGGTTVAGQTMALVGG